MAKTEIEGNDQTFLAWIIIAFFSTKLTLMLEKAERELFLISKGTC